MNTTCLIVSCDKFQDAWPAALACLSKYWPESECWCGIDRSDNGLRMDIVCPKHDEGMGRRWPLRTMSNLKPWGTNPLLVGPDTNWVNNLRLALDQIDTPLVLAFLEDMLLCREVNNNDVLLAERLMLDVHSIGAMRLGQGNELCEKSETPTKFARILEDSPYRISTSPTLWRVSYLRQVLADCGETAWDFEIKGTQRSRDLTHCIWSIFPDDDALRPFRCYYTGIEKGRWIGECLEWLKTLGIEVADTSRGITWLKDRK